MDTHVLCLFSVNNAVQGNNNVSKVVDIAARVLGFIPVLNTAAGVINGINSVIYSCTVGCMTVSCSYIKRQLLSMDMGYYN